MTASDRLFETGLPLASHNGLKQEMVVSRYDGRLMNRHSALVRCDFIVGQVAFGKLCARPAALPQRLPCTDPVASRHAPHFVQCIINYVDYLLL